MSTPDRIPQVYADGYPARWDTRQFLSDLQELQRLDPKRLELVAVALICQLEDARLAAQEATS